MKIPVLFTYHTGVPGDVLPNVRQAVLRGSWDGDGRYSDSWTPTEMVSTNQGEDGSLRFNGTINLDSTQAGQDFRWGVAFVLRDGSEVWGIPTEIRDRNSTARYRTFRFSGANHHERYWLTHCRRLGANKVFAGGVTPGETTAKPGIRFALWAPNARNVEVVIGHIWDRDNPEKTVTAGNGVDIKRILGGYISDAHEGIEVGIGPFAMSPNGDGVWVTDANDSMLSKFELLDHRPYMFRITKDDGTISYCTDLYSRCQIGAGASNPFGRLYNGRIVDLEGTVSCSVVVDPDTVTEFFREDTLFSDKEDWTPSGRVRVWPERSFIPADRFWQNEFDPARPLPKRVEDLVIYELHVGALGFNNQDAQPVPGTLEDAIRFLEHLQALGVNAVELLPMAQFGGGAQNWGYATSHYFAIEYGGGGRDQYKFFIRECHRRGIAVIVDVVYNHYIQEHAERAEWMRDSNSDEKNVYYWYEGLSSSYPEFDRAVPDQRGRGGYLDNVSTGFAPRYYEEMVRSMFISSAAALILDFHVDGFRVDQTTSIHSYNALHANGQPVPDANAFGAKFLREFTRTLRMIRPGIMLMAEDHSGWDRVTAPTDEDGLGFDAVWYADFYHHLIGDTDKGSDYAKLLKTAGLGDDRALAMDYFAGALASSGGKRVVYSESHDEAGNGQGTDRTIVTAVNGAPLLGDTRRYAEARCRCVFGITMLAAGTPMFLFGEEVGSEKKFLYDRVLENREDLEGERQTTGRFLFKFYGDLIRFRLAHPGLRTRSIDVLHVHNANRVVAFRRWGDGEDLLVLTSLRNAPFSDGYVVENGRLPDGQWQEVFNSDASVYGGNNAGNLGATISSVCGRFDAVIPANAVVVFRKL